jgi:hypothetical protein
MINIKFTTIKIHLKFEIKIYKLLVEIDAILLDIFLFGLDIKR